MNKSGIKLQGILDKYSDLSLENAIKLTKELIRIFGINAPKIIRLKVKNLYDIIINETVFVNQIPNHKFITNVRYFIDRQKELIQCSRCGNPLLVNLTLWKPYPAWHSRCIQHNYNVNQFLENSYYNRNPAMFINLIDELNNSPTGFATRLKYSRQDIVDWMKSELIFMIECDSYSIKYLIYCILNDIKNYPKCHKCNQEMTSEKHFMGLYEGFHPYCSNYCAQTSPEVSLIIRQSLKKKYGKDIRSSMEIKEVMLKSRSKYTYDDKQFDSKPELAFYIWLKDNNINFRYHDKDLFFTYTWQNKKSKYYPDFVLSCGLVIEIKGIQFFKNYDKTQKMILPYNYRNHLSKDKIKILNEQYEAKHQCMMNNNVIILTNDEYQQYLDYVKSIYGPSFLDSLKNR